MSVSEENKTISGYQEDEITISYAFSLINRQKKSIVIGVVIVMIATLIYFAGKLILCIFVPFLLNTEIQAPLK